MVFPYKSFITKEDVRIYGGYRLEEILIQDDTPNVDTLCDNALREIARMIYDYLPPYKRDAIYADKNNEEALARCQLYQMVYIIENGDLSSRNGSSNFININELRGYRNLAPSAYQEMLKQGWLYCGGINIC